MKLYRWMSDEEFLAMQKGEIIRGKNHSKERNTSSNGVCFFPEKMTVKLVEDEASNFYVRPIDLYFNEILELPNDTDYKYNAADGCLSFLPSDISRDVFVEFEIDDSKVFNFSNRDYSWFRKDNSANVLLENWGVYHNFDKEFGNEDDKILVIEYALNYYSTKILKPTRFVSFTKSESFDLKNIHNLKLTDSNFTDYSRDAKLNRYTKIDNSNLEEYQFLADLRESYSKEIAEKVVSIRQDEHIFGEYYGVWPEVRADVNHSKRCFMQTIEKMLDDGASIGEIKDTCYFAYFEHSEDFSYTYQDSEDDECTMKVYLPYLKDYLDEAIENISSYRDKDKDFSYFLEQEIVKNYNSLIENNSLTDERYDISYLTNELIDFKKEKCLNCEIESLVKEVNSVAKENNIDFDTSQITSLQKLMEISPDEIEY